MPDVVYSHDQLDALFGTVGDRLQAIRDDLPDTSESPIATTNDAVNITQGLQGALIDTFKAEVGDVGKTAFYVQAVLPGGGQTRVACLESGLLFINNVYIQAMFVSEVYEYTATIGDKLEMRGGGLNATNRVNLADTPCEVNNTANAAVEYFWNRFRETEGFEFTTATLPVETNIRVWGPNPTFVNGVVTGTPQHDIDIPAGQTVDYITVGAGEYYMLATQKVIHTSSNNFQGSAVDARAINPPVVGPNIVHTRSGGGDNLSSLRANNNVTARQRSGESAVFTASPGSPGKIDVGIGGNTDYDPNDIAILYPDNGETVSYSGADSGGRNATQGQSLRSASNNFVTPLDSELTGIDARGVLFGAYECEWFVFNPDGSYRGTIEMRRGNSGGTSSPAATPEHQLYPAAVNYGPNEGIFSDTNIVPRGTRFIGNMRGFMIANFHEPTNGFANEDEITIFGTVIPSYLCETRTRQSGLLERLVINETTGASTWEPA